MSEYERIQPIDRPIPANRQGAKRHYGVHPYFTRRPYNVVRSHILRYSTANDRVADPFGGSGVTAIEAFLENRTGIQNDLNPLANFIASGIVGLAEGRVLDYKEALAQLQDACRGRLATALQADSVALDRMKRSLPLPENAPLPANADVPRLFDLFTPRQLVGLAIIKQEIDRLKDRSSRSGMLLAWSAALAKIDKTFLSATGRAVSRGGSSIFSIYRYKVAKEPVDLPLWDTFEERARNIIGAKAEIDSAIELKKRTTGWSGRFECRSQDIEEMSCDVEGTVDYIFTDPPYGGHISYLDLSTMWNAWLDQLPDLYVREKELIVGGDLRLSEDYYTSRLRGSIRACVRMLKPGRWLSVVFQHWNIAYFQAILSGALDENADLRAAVSQVGDPIWSMHKKKNRDSVLAGELILTFYKSCQPISLRPPQRFDLESSISMILAESQSDSLYSEAILNQLVIAAWRASALESLDISRNQFIALIESRGWAYDDANHRWIRSRPSQPTLFAVA